MNQKTIAQIVSEDGNYSSEVGRKTVSKGIENAAHLLAGINWETWLRTFDKVARKPVLSVECIRYFLNRRIVPDTSKTYGAERTGLLRRPLQKTELNGYPSFVPFSGIWPGYSKYRPTTVHAFRVVLMSDPLNEDLATLPPRQLVCFHVAAGERSRASPVFIVR